VQRLRQARACLVSSMGIPVPLRRTWQRPRFFLPQIMNQETSNKVQFERLTSHEIIGLIQLLTDTNQISEDQRNGYYMYQNDRRIESLSIFETLTQTDINAFLKHLKRLDYID